MIEDHQQNQTLFATIIFQSNALILKSLNTICWLKKEYFLLKKVSFHVNYRKIIVEWIVSQAERKKKHYIGSNNYILILSKWSFGIDI